MKNNLGHRPLDLSRLMILSLYGWLMGRFFKKDTTKLPKRIGEYFYIGKIKKLGSKHTFLLGLYKTKAGKRAIAKMWYGNVHDFHYFTFRNELTMYKIVNAILSRTRSSMPKKFARMHVPQLLAVHEKNSSLLILLEFVDGVVASDLTDQKKIATYLMVFDFLGYIGGKMTTEEKNQISKRTPWHYIFLYPLLLCKSLLTHPRAAGSLLRAMPLFLQSIPIMIRGHQSSLVHRDLHLRNILYSQKKITLIDLQFCVFTNSLYELVTTVRYRWNKDTFYKLLYGVIWRRYKNQQNFERLFRGLCVNSATHGLTDKTFSHQRIDDWIDFLRFIIKPKILIS